MQLFTNRPPNNGYTNHRTMQRNGNGNYNSNNGGRYRTPNGNGRSQNGNGSEPPFDWKKFAELTFKVSNVPFKAEVTEIKDAFAAYGNVYRVIIETKDKLNGEEQPTGAAFVSYRFV